MELKNFDSVRVGSGFPGCVDVYKIQMHESYGVYAQAWTYRGGKEECFVQVRKHNKEHLVALFSFRIPVELPEFWQDSTVLWDSRETGGE